MAIKITLDSFLAVIKRSTLLSEEQVDAALEAFRAGNGVTTDAKPFAEYLVRTKQLTVWQAEKVLQGKHKGFFLGRYRLLSLLGKGGMSSVYLAEHTVMKRHCALKVLPAKRVNDASYLGRFHREAQAVAALDHPNIVRAYDVDMATDAGIEIHFLSMEFVKGKNLLELVQEQGPLPIAQAADMVRQSALGLEHAHRAGLVHRDIKPGNLLVTPTGIIKVLDLGLARFFDDGDHSLTVQHDEKVLGTADYISPEQAIDSHKVDARTDIYSLGCTLYFLLSGHPPFNTGSLAQRLIAHQTQPAPAITIDRPDVPADLQAIMEKMMAKKLDQRYQTAHEVAADLEKWLAKSGTVSVPEAVLVTPEAVDAKSAASQTAPTGNSPATARPVAGSAQRSKKPPGPGDRTGFSPTQSGTSRSSEPVRDNTGGDALEALGNPLAGLSSRIDPDGQVPGPNDSTASRSSSRKLTQAAADTSKRNPSRPGAVTPSLPIKPEGSGLDFLDQVFNPSLLNVDGLEIVAEPAGSDVRLEKRSTATSKSGVRRSTKPAVPSKTQNSPATTWPFGWVVTGAVIVLLAVVGWLILGGDMIPLDSPNIPPIVKPSKPTNPAMILPSADLALIDVGPQGHFATIGQALDFVRENFRPLGSRETRTIQVQGGVTYSETIEIVSGGRSHFPRNVILKSMGANPAVIQGDGNQPVLNLQETESLSIEGFVIDAQGAGTAIQVSGYSPAGRLTSLKVKHFTKTGVLLEDVAAQSGEEFRLSALHIQGDSPDAVGVRCQAAKGGNTVFVRLENLRIIGPLRSGIETSGTLWNSSVSDSVMAKCAVGLQFLAGTLIDVSLVNNTLFENDRGIVFTQVPNVGSGNLKVLHTLFQGNAQADAELESGDANAMTNVLLSPTEGRHHNWSNRKDPDPQGFDVFTGDGQRGIVSNFMSNDFSSPDYLRPSNSELNVASPASGAKGYVGAVAP